MNNLYKKWFLVSFICSSPLLADAVSELYPLSLVQLDQSFSHHVIIAEKSTHKIHLYKNQNGMPHYIKSYNAATGKRKGNKFVKGDLKTPEGIYRITDFISGNELIEKYGQEQGKIYGAGAFVLNYPNEIDRRENKTGGGIWLHSTNDNSRVNKGLDSRGCVVIVDNDLKDISQYIELNKTTLLIVQDLIYLSQEAWINKRKSLKSFVDNWLSSWRDENLKSYISHYHPTKFKDPYRGSFKSFKTYKKAVFYGQGKPSIDVENLSIFNSTKYAIVQFTQIYKSKRINDTGKKTLYLMLDINYDWKIVSEKWQKSHTLANEKMAFTPSMRFFNNN